MPLFDVTLADAFDPADVAPAILEAIGDAALAGGGVIYFPPGEYPVGETVHVADAHCLRFLGEGAASVVVRNRADDTAGIFLFERCAGIVIERLALDANRFQPPDGSSQRALAQFDRCERITVQDASAFDSDPLPDPELGGDRDAITHRYDTAHHVAFGFWNSGPDLAVMRCRLESLGIAVHRASRVRIVDNELIGPIGHGIAVGALTNGQPSDDVWIQGNRIREPARFGIVAADIPPTPELGFEPLPLHPSFPMRRVRIEGNSVTKTLASWARGIVVGLLDHRPSMTVGGREGFTAFYEDVRVSGNRIDLTSDESRPPRLGEGSTPAEERSRTAGIWLQAQPAGPDEPAGTAFLHASVTDNLIRGARADEGGGGAGVLAWNLRESEVGGNGVYGADDGIVLSGELLETHIHDNRVEARVRRYRYGVSAGRNNFGSNATLDFESQKTVWERDGTDPSDQFLGGDTDSGGQGLIGGG